MQVVSWNVNSLRVRWPHVETYLRENAPDVLLLQELKCLEKDLPRFEIEASGYHILHACEKNYNGVAILSKEPAEHIHDKLPGYTEDEQSRYLECLYQGYRIICVYVPNGNPMEGPKFAYKKRWLSHLKTHIKALLEKEESLIIGGDFNIIPEDIDVYAPDNFKNDALFVDEIRAIYREIQFLGYRDAHYVQHPQQKQAYTYWDYQGQKFQHGEGLRIDHFLLSPKAADRLEDCYIDKTPRGWEQPSDHTPIICRFKSI